MIRVASQTVLLAAKLAEAQQRADELLARAAVEAQDRGRKLRDEAERQVAESRAERRRLFSAAETASRVAKSQAQTVLPRSAPGPWRLVITEYRPAAPLGKRARSR
jgi:hypothetical protein